MEEPKVVVELTSEQRDEVVAIINNARAEAEALVGPDEGKDPAEVAKAEAFAGQCGVLAAVFA
jgi:hypothetical protein